MSRQNGKDGISKYICEILIFICFFSLLLILVFMWKSGICNNKSYILLVAPIGITALIVPLILSISSKYNIGSKLDSGEVRKSIVVSLTIVYIVFLAISFQESLNPQENDGMYSAILNMTVDSNTSDGEKQTMLIELNSTSKGVLQVIPLTATANVSGNTAHIIPMVPAKNGTEGERSAGMIPLSAENNTAIPSDAINSFTKNFLWIYALIISFYFSSRILEKRADKGNINEYIENMVDKGASPLDIANHRYVRGDIGSREFNTMKEDLKEPDSAKIEIDDAFYYKPKEVSGNSEEDKTELATVIILRNLTNEKIKLSNIYVDGVRVEHSEYGEIEGFKSKIIKTDTPEPEAGHKYNINIAIEGNAVEHKTTEIPVREESQIKEMNPNFLHELNEIKIKVG